MTKCEKCLHIGELKGYTLSDGNLSINFDVSAAMKYRDLLKLPVLTLPVELCRQFITVTDHDPKHVAHVSPKYPVLLAQLPNFEHFPAALHLRSDRGEELTVCFLDGSHRLVRNLRDRRPQPFQLLPVDFTVKCVSGLLVAHKIDREEQAVYDWVKARGPKVIKDYWQQEASV